MGNRSSTGRTILFVILGLIFGGILGESLGLLFETFGEMAGSKNNPVFSFFMTPFTLDFGFDQGGYKLDLYLIKINFGMGFKFNVVSILGVAASLYIEKWSRGH